MKFVRTAYPKVEKNWPWLAHNFAYQFFFMPIKFKRPARENVAYKTAQIQKIEYKNKTVHIYTWGSPTKPPLLMVHGWMGRATQFFELVNRLRNDYFVISFDAPAHGESKGLKTDIREFAQIIEYIHQSYGPIYGSIGHSMGGAALVYASSLGTPIDRLCMIASPTIGRKILQAYSKIINGSEQTVEKFDQQVRLKYNVGFNDFAASELLKEVSIPRLQLVYDHDDKEVDFEHGKVLREIRPDAVFLESRGLGHSRILRDPETLRQIIEFINDK